MLVWRGLLVLAAFYLAPLSLAFTTGPCQKTPECQCKWSGGKRMADCSRSGFKSIPSTLSPDIQALVMDQNPLRKLDKDAFKSAGLLNIRTLSLRQCDIYAVDENAFRDLKIMTHLDLSLNNITKISPKTFDGNENLKTMTLSHNPITSLSHYQFPPLSSLKTVDLSHCHLDDIDRTAFKNLGGSVDTVLLNDNRLTYLREEVFVPLVNLKKITLHNNPWKCDCRLKNFRDYVVNKGLYDRPTSCNDPGRLNGKTWDTILPIEFACKPRVELPIERYFAAPGVDTTLACRILGSPIPRTRWVYNGRIVNNNSYPQPFADQTYLLHEEKITHDGVERWFNLTITRPGEHDLGDYICVAENTGGVMEKTVVLTFDDPANYSTGIPMFTNEQWHILIGALVCVLLLLLLLVLVCYCCLCRNRRKDNKKNRTPSGERNGYVNNSDNQKLIPNASNGSIVAVSGHQVAKPTTRMGEYQGLPQTDLLGYVPADKYDIEMRDMRTPSIISNTKPGSSSASSSASDGGRATSVSRASYIATDHHPTNNQYPDLLDHHHHMPNAAIYSTLMRPGSATSSDPSRMHTLNPANLMLTPQQQAQYAHLISSPFQRSGTLPLPQGYAAMPLTVIHPHHQAHNQQQARPGYVTLPRRPRANWSVPRDTPSPSSSTISRNLEREPIYDGIGPRTSADGSSRLSLNKTLPSPKGSQSTTSSNPRYALPPYCAPIEELQECPPTPKPKPKMQTNSTPNILDISTPNNSNGPLLNPSSSEATLIEENLSGYCEPFGKAEVPSKASEERSEGKKSSNNRNSITSASSVGSELDLSSKDRRDTNKDAGPKPKRSSTPLRNGGSSLNSNGNVDLSVLSEIPSSNLENGNRSRPSAPPKTLPKPKVKPVPPPKPKKSFQEQNADSSQAPLISFQDEGVDGSEV